MENKIERPLDTEHGYWRRNHEANTYSSIITWVKKFYPDAQSAIEVGCYVSDLLCDLEYIPYRVANDRQDLTRFWGHVKDVKFVKGDFTTIDWSSYLPEGKNKFDVLICSYTIEHVRKPRAFADELKRISSDILVSTTYKTRFGQTLGHINDPITMELLCDWFQPLYPREILISSSNQLTRDNAWGILALFTDKQKGPPIWMTHKWLERLDDYPYQDTKQE